MYCRYFQEFVDILTEELITEASIIPFERYGQIIFLIGGAGSGKNFVLQNLLAHGGVNVDIDETKAYIKNNRERVIQALQRKIAAEQNESKIAKYEEYIKVLADKKNDLDMTDSKIATMLHNIGSALFKINGKESKLITLMNAAANAKKNGNVENLSNAVVNASGKDLDKVLDTAKGFVESGYKPENIHIVWVLTPFDEALENNENRDRKAPREVMEETHSGVIKTMKKITNEYNSLGLKKVIDGKVIVLFNSKAQDGDYVFQKVDDGNVFKYANNINRVVLKDAKQPVKSKKEIDKELKAAYKGGNGIKDYADFEKKQSAYTKNVPK